MEKNEIYKRGDTYRIYGVPYARFPTRIAASRFLNPLPKPKPIEENKPIEETFVWKSLDSTSPQN